MVRIRAPAGRERARRARGEEYRALARTSSSSGARTAPKLPHPKGRALKEAYEARTQYRGEPLSGRSRSRSRSTSRTGSAVTGTTGTSYPAMGSPASSGTTIARSRRPRCGRPSIGSARGLRSRSQKEKAGYEPAFPVSGTLIMVDRGEPCLDLPYRDQQGKSGCPCKGHLVTR
jgi:hypothetical protein